MESIHKPRHRSLDVNGLEISYREAGAVDMPCVLLLHGFPSSSHLFRNVMPPLAEVSRVIAPDLPGFGFSDSPGVDEYEYTFANLADTVEAFLAQVGGDQFFVYLHDFGAPVGYHLATRYPERVLGLIVQNGNAHEDGLARVRRRPHAAGDPLAGVRGGDGGVRQERDGWRVSGLTATAGS